MRRIQEIKKESPVSMKNVYSILMCFLSLGSFCLDASKDPATKAPSIDLSQQEELDPIKKLKLAYTLQKMDIQPKKSESTPEPALQDPEDSSSLKKKILGLGKTYIVDASIYYLMNYGIASLRQQPVDHQSLLKGALIHALRIPTILDTLYRIPFKIGLYAEDSSKESEGYTIAKTFVEDAAVDYAVNYTYHAGIFGEKVDHMKLAQGALLSACRLPFALDTIVRYAII